MGARMFSTLCLSALAAGCPSESSERAASRDATPQAALRRIDPTTTSTLSGVVRFEGALPEPTMVDASGDAACRALHPGAFDAGDVRGEAGKVEAAFVYVASGLEGYGFDVPAAPVIVDQRGCMYAPRIFGARPGQMIEFRNSDQTLHNIASKPKNSRGFNFVTPQGASGSRAIKSPEVMVKIGCDVHPWMRAWAGVVDHPFFATTAAGGAFSLKGLPPGRYEIAAWHERLGAARTSVEIGPQSSKAIELTLRP